MTATADRPQVPPGSPSPARPATIYGPDYRRLTLGVVSVMLLIAFEGTAVITVMPVAVRALDGLAAYAIAFSAFFTTSLLGMVWSGQRSDATGPLVPLFTGAVAFGAGLVLAGLAPGMGIFVLGRAVQGLGAGTVVVAMYVLAARAYPDELRPQVFSAFAACWVLPSVIGPVIAGLIAEHLGWRWVFLAVPMLVLPPVLAMLPALRGLDGPPLAASAGGEQAGAPAAVSRRLLPAAVGTALGVALLQYAGQHLDRFGLAAVAGALVLLVPALPRLLPHGSLRAARGLPTVVLMRGLLAGAFFGAETFVPLMLITERGLSPTLAGLSLGGAAFGWTAGAWYQGRPGRRRDRARLVRLGSLAVGAGIVGAAAAACPPLPSLLAAVGWTVAGLGMGLALSSLGTLLLQLSAPREAGANSAALQICDALGTAVFVALGGTIFAALYGDGGAGATVFVLIDAVMVAVALAAFFIGVRIRPRDACDTIKPTVAV